MSPGGDSVTACPFQKAMDTSLQNVAFDKPEHLASMYPSSRDRAGAMPAIQAAAKSMLTDVDAAAESLWTSAQQVIDT